MQFLRGIPEPSILAMALIGAAMVSFRAIKWRRTDSAAPAAIKPEADD